MKLSIDSTLHTELTIRLDETAHHFFFSSPREQDILATIVTLLDQQKVTSEQISEIWVEPGPGTFTSLRVGIAIALMLSYAWNIPINGHPAGTSISAEYGTPPSITLSKKKYG